MTPGLEVAAEERSVLLASAAGERARQLSNLDSRATGQAGGLTVGTDGLSNDGAATTLADP